MVKILLWLTMLIVAGTATAQEPLPVPANGDQAITTLKLGTRIVGVSAVVLDNHSEPVKGLTKDDFVLKQDGKEQEIRYFSQDSDLPLTLALMVDTSGSQKMFIEDETDASRKFFKVMLTNPNDRAVLVQFDTNVLQLQKMTNDTVALTNALSFLSIPHQAGYNARGGTLLYDAIIAASQVVLGRERGRRAMVILTDGDDNGSRYNLDQAVAAAQRADIVVYSVLYSMQESGFLSGGGGYGMHGGGNHDGRNVLEKLSSATGGHVFTVTQKTPLDLIYTQIADDMRLQYQLGYTPPEAQPGSYHKIELKPKVKHLTVQARQGYYSPK